MFMYVNIDHKLQQQYAETWVFGMFSCCIRHGKYISGVCGIRRHGTHTFRLQPNSICDSIVNALELRLCWTSLSIYNIPLRINHYL